MWTSFRSPPPPPKKNPSHKVLFRTSRTYLLYYILTQLHMVAGSPASVPFVRQSHKVINSLVSGSVIKGTR